MKNTENLSKSNIFNNYLTNFYYIMITITSVGYGDYYPTSIFGRIFCFILCLFGMAILSLFVMHLTNLTILDSVEEKSFSSIIRLYKH